MRKIILLFFTICSVIVSAQNNDVVRSSDIEQIKKSKLIIGLTKDENWNAALKKVVKDFWSFTDIYTTMPKDEALLMA